MIYRVGNEAQVSEQVICGFYADKAGKKAKWIGENIGR